MSDVTLTDKNLINLLTTRSLNEINFKNIDSNLLDILKINSNVKSNKSQHIKNLYDLFINLQNDDSVINEFLSYKLAKTIISFFMNDVNENNYPCDLFKNKFIDFIINNDLFFKNMFFTPVNTNIFRILVSKEKNLKYFSFSIEKKYINFYINEIRNIEIFIKTQLLTYVVLNSYEINLSINTIRLVNDFLSNIDGEILDKNKILQTNTLNLFTTTYIGLSNMCCINNSSYEIYKEAYNSLVQNSHNKYLLDIKEQLDITLDNIDKLSKCNIFKDILNNKINNMTVEKYLEYQANSDKIIEVFSFYVCETTSLDKNINTNMINNLIYNLLINDKVLLHHKSDLIIFNKNWNFNYIPSLLDIFKKINVLNSANSPQRNKNLNKTILSILNEYLSKIININIFKMVNNNDFITIYSSLIIDTLQSIQSELSIYTRSQRHNNKMIIVKEILNLKVYIKFLNNYITFITINSEFNKDIFYFKMAEVFYSFLNFSIKTKIHSQLSMFYCNPKTIPIIPKSFNKKLDSIFRDIYICFNTLIINDLFIDIFTIHKEFYNKDYLREIQINYGKFQLNTKRFNLHQMIEYFILRYEECLEEKDKKEIKYKTDIPNKFLDPIMFTPIETPIVVPDVNEIVDRYMIYNHLVFNHTNPFTNKPLTTKELDDYNKRADIILKLKKFTNEFKEWKLNNKIK